MATIERYQNPVPNDTVVLRLFVYNQNSFSNVQSIEKVEIYKMPDDASINDVSKGTLFRTISPPDIKQDDTGKYYVDLVADYPLFTVGKYVDIWHVVFASEEGKGKGNGSNISKITEANTTITKNNLGTGIGSL
jgi:hypothetical protein